MQNNVQLEGRLVRDPEVTYTPTGLCKCKFTIAQDRPVNSRNPKKEGQQTADFFPVVAWQELGEELGNNIHKGSWVNIISGQLRIDKYTDRENKPRSYAYIIARNVFYDQPKQTSPMDAFTKAPEQPRAVQPPAPAPQPKVEDAPLPFDSEIPF